MGHSTDLVDRLTEAAVECKQLLREIHSAQKQLRKDSHDAQECVRLMEDALERMAAKATEEAMTSAIHDTMMDSTEQIMKILEKRSQLVLDQFEKLTAKMDKYMIEGEEVDLEGVVDYFQKLKADKLRETLG